MRDGAKQREQEIQARALTTVDDDMVERGAQQLWAEMDTWASAAWCNEWARQPEHTRNAYRSYARAALHAALGTGEGA